MIRSCSHGGLFLFPRPCSRSPEREFLARRMVRSYSHDRRNRGSDAVFLFPRYRLGHSSMRIAFPIPRCAARDASSPAWRCVRPGGRAVRSLGRETDARSYFPRSSGSVGWAGDAQSFPIPRWKGDRDNEQCRWRALPLGNLRNERICGSKRMGLYIKYQIPKRGDSGIRNE